MLKFDSLHGYNGLGAPGCPGAGSGDITTHTRYNLGTVRIYRDLLRSRYSVLGQQMTQED